MFLGVGEAGGVVLSHIARLLKDDRYLATEQKPPFLLVHADTREGDVKSDDPRLTVQKLQLYSRSFGGSNGKPSYAARFVSTVIS